MRLRRALLGALGAAAVLAATAPVGSRVASAASAGLAYADRLGCEAGLTAAGFDAEFDAVRRPRPIPDTRTDTGGPGVDVDDDGDSDRGAGGRGHHARPPGDSGSGYTISRDALFQRAVSA